jgi:hypothetical protein
MDIMAIHQMVPWLASGCAAGILTLLVAIRIRFERKSLRILTLIACLLLLICGNIYWFSEIDRRGGRVSAPVWRLVTLPGSEMSDLWHDYPERLAVLSERIDAYMAIRRYCHGAPLVLCEGTLSDAGLTEKMILGLAGVVEIKERGQKCYDCCSFSPEEIARVESIQMRDGFIFEFGVRPDGSESKVLVWIKKGIASFSAPDELVPYISPSGKARIDNGK